MNTFGNGSRRQLATADARLRTLAHEVLKIKDHSVIKGHRGEAEQNEAFASGASKLPWPKGKHNAMPSLAIDVQTHPRPDDEQKLKEEQLYLLGLYRGVASEAGIPLRTGADFDRDGQTTDSTFFDGFHVEIDWGP